MSSETPADQLLRVFISYASEDKYFVRILYNLLSTEGLDVWLDEERLAPGQDWELEIHKAVRNCHIAIVCLSPRSITKAGFVQKEIKYVLDVADEQPEGTIFLIPVKLEPCDPPDRVKKLHWGNLYDRKGYQRLMFAIRQRANSIGINIEPKGYLRQDMTLFNPDDLPEPYKSDPSVVLFGELIALNNQGKFEESASRLESYLDENPADYYVLYHYLQDIREYHGQDEIVIRILDKKLPSIRLDDPEWAGRLLKNRALALLFGRYGRSKNREDLLKAMNDLFLSVEYNPKISESWLHLAIISTIEGDFLNADKYLAYAINTSADGEVTGGMNDMRMRLRNDPAGFLSRMKEFYVPKLH